MTKILDIPNSNYKIAVQPGGNITLNTGVDVGQVIITGDLLVQGEQTTLNTTELEWPCQFEMQGYTCPSSLNYFHQNFFQPLFYQCYCTGTKSTNRV